MGITRTNLIFQEGAVSVGERGLLCVKGIPAQDMAMLPFYWGFEQVRGQLCVLIWNGCGSVCSRVDTGSSAHSSVLDAHVVTSLPGREVKNAGGLPSGP